MLTFWDHSILKSLMCCHNWYRLCWKACFLSLRGYHRYHTEGWDDNTWRWTICPNWSFVFFWKKTCVRHRDDGRLWCIVVSWRHSYVVKSPGNTRNQDAACRNTRNEDGRKTQQRWQSEDAMAARNNWGEALTAHLRLSAVHTLKFSCMFGGGQENLKLPNHFEEDELASNRIIPRLLSRDAY